MTADAQSFIDRGCSFAPPDRVACGATVSFGCVCGCGLIAAFCNVHAMALTSPEVAARCGSCNALIADNLLMLETTRRDEARAE